MRTTLNIPDKILREARIRAAEQHASLTEFIAEAIQRAVQSPSRASTSATTKLPTFRGKGLRPGVDLDDTSGLLDIMDGRP
jgi:hypothetical protein